MASTATSAAIMLVGNRTSKSRQVQENEGDRSLRQGQGAVRRLALEDGELVPEGEDLRLEVEARPNGGPEGGEQGDERGRHGGREP